MFFFFLLFKVSFRIRRTLLMLQPCLVAFSSPGAELPFVRLAVLHNQRAHFYEDFFNRDKARRKPIF